MKKFVLFFVLFFGYLVGSIGAAAYLAYDGHYQFAAASVLLTVMAWPTAKKWWYELNE